MNLVLDDWTYFEQIFLVTGAFMTLVNSWMFLRIFSGFLSRKTEAKASRVSRFLFFESLDDEAEADFVAFSIRIGRSVAKEKNCINRDQVLQQFLNCNKNKMLGVKIPLLLWFNTKK